MNPNIVLDYIPESELPAEVFARTEDVDIICINWYEWIRIVDVNKHSMICNTDNSI